MKNKLVLLTCIGLTVLLHTELRAADGGDWESRHGGDIVSIDSFLIALEDVMYQILDAVLDVIPYQILDALEDVIPIGIMLVVIFTILLLVVIDRLSPTNPGVVTLDTIPLLVDSLQNTGSEGAFILFSFYEKIEANGYAPGLQYSIENGKLGIDYLLNSEFNKYEINKFNSIISKLGCKSEEKEMNGVEYIRIEDGSLVEIGQEILRRLYQVKGNEKMDVDIEGFDYKKE